jgi:hypothetical protein
MPVGRVCLGETGLLATGLGGAGLLATGGRVFTGFLTVGLARRQPSPKKRISNNQRRLIERIEWSELTAKSNDSQPHLSLINGQFYRLAIVRQASLQ